MAEDGRVRVVDRRVALAGRQTRLSKREQDLAEWIVARHRQAAFRPPALEQLKSEATHNRAVVEDIVELLVRDGRLVRITPEYVIAAEAAERMERSLREALKDGRHLTVSDIRQLLKTSRKYAVPLCEYADRIGLTRRLGDVRVLGES
jgi:selenocysteine-specific elongation factor